MKQLQSLDLNDFAERVAERVAAKLVGQAKTARDLDDDRLVDEREAAGMLAVKPATLAAWRCKGGGPIFLKIGSGKRTSIRYRAGDLRAWAEARRYANTAHRLGNGDG